MKFCPKCGSLLLADKDKNLIRCSKCDFSEEYSDKLQMREKIKRSSSKIDVADDMNHLAVYDHRCKKCGYEKAQLIEKSALWTDEDDIVAWKCGKCGNIEREHVKEK